MFPVMVDTPTISKARERLEGVKTTLKRVAEKLELLWQVLSEDDWIRRSADAMGSSATRAVINRPTGEREQRMLGRCAVVVILRGAV